MKSQKVFLAASKKINILVALAFQRKRVYNFLEVNKNKLFFFVIKLFSRRLLEKKVEPMYETDNFTLPFLLKNNRYIVEKEIGRGGMGLVYEGVDKVQKRAVAIKAFHGLSEKEQKRFEREYLLLREFKHPHIVKAIDFFSERNTLFMVLELVYGQSMNSFLQGDQFLSMPERLAIAHQISSAIDFLNFHKIVHRDIKPDNIMINLSKGQAKLLDLGIGKDIAGPNQSLTLDQSIIGTLAYLSPEQADGQIDIRSDIFSWGVTLYQFFLWQPQSPFYDSNSLTTILKIGSFHPPTVLSEWEKIAAPHVREKEYENYKELSFLVEKAMKKLPQERWQQANELLEPLAKLQESFLGYEHHKESVCSPAMLSLTSKNLKAKEKTPQRLLIQKSIWIFLTIGLLLLSILFLPKENTSLTPSQQAEQHFKKAYQLFLEHEFEEAWQYNETACKIKETPRYLAQKALLLYHRSGKGRDRSKARSISSGIIEELEKKGDAYSYEALGLIYFLIYGGRDNLGKAAEYFHEGAKLGSSESMVYLGAGYQSGVSEANMPKNINLARDFYQRAADLGNIHALNKLGYWYLVKKNKKKAMDLFEKACEKGNRDACVHLGRMYLKRKEKGDEKLALEAFHKAIKKRNPDAMIELGKLYFQGEVVPLSKEKAIGWYKKAIAEGNRKAMEVLGDLYAKEQQYEKALLWLKKARSPQAKSHALEKKIKKLEKESQK